MCNPGTHARKLVDQEIKTTLAKLSYRELLELGLARNAQRGAGRESLSPADRKAGLALPLRTPLQEIGGPLCAIPAADRLAEVEFTFPERLGDPLPADIRWEEGFVTGFMDLLFPQGQ